MSEKKKIIDYTKKELLFTEGTRKQGQKLPLDTPKRIIERREGKRRERERKVEGEI